MKIVKRILIGIACLIALLLIIALFVKKEYTLEKEVIINKPRQEVYDYVRMFANQPEFNPWLHMDPETKTGIIGNDGETGAMYTWESKIIGKGEQKIVGLSNGETIQYQLHFIEPFEGLANHDLFFESLSPEQTKVRNTFSSSMPYPMNLMMLCMSMDNTVGKELQNGLNNIKAALEGR